MSRTAEFLRDARRNAPPWSVSLAIHALLLALLAGVTWVAHDREEPPASIELQTVDPTEISADPMNLAGNRERARGAMGESAADQLQRNDRSAQRTTTPEPIPEPPTEQPAEAPSAASELTPRPRGEASRSTDPAMAMLARQASQQQTRGGANQAPRGAGLEGTSRGFQRMVRTLRRRGIDVVLVLDATDSMEPYIRQARQRLRRVIGVLSALANPEGENPRPNLVRFGLVAFKDYGDEYGVNATRRLPLTDDRDAVLKRLEQVIAGGGADDPEPIHRALAVATDEDKMGWRPGRLRVIILATDAPVHGTGREAAVRIAERFGRQRHARLTVLDVGGAGEAPARRAVLPDLEKIAEAGGGTAYLLKNEIAFWRELITGIFGQRFARDVDTIVERYGDPG